MDIHTDKQPYRALDKLCVLAPGLLGASVAMASKKCRAAKTVNIWARRSSTRAILSEQSWCDEVFSNPEEAVAEADLVVICTPVDFIIPLLNEIRNSMKPGALVTDVGSTKSLVCRQANAEADQAVGFIGSHPMAGSEKTGMEHASEDLFVNRPCIVTPLENAEEAHVIRVVRFWNSLGAITTIKSPEDHDEIVAHISHLPHLVASGLCHFLDQKPNEWESLSSTGLRDVTRIAAGDPALWRAIIESNSEEIKRALSKFQDELQRIQSALTNGNMVELISILEKGKQFRERLN